MAEFSALVRWLVVYAVSGGFWHFVAVFLVLGAIAKFTTIVSVWAPNNSKCGKAKDDADD